MNTRAVFATLFLLIGIGAGEGEARGESHGGVDNPLVCGWVRERIAEAASQLNSLRLNDFLFKAADEGCANVVAELLDRGASVRASDRFANTALIYAAGGGTRMSCACCSIAALRSSTGT